MFLPIILFILPSAFAIKRKAELKERSRLKQPVFATFDTISCPGSPCSHKDDKGNTARRKEQAMKVAGGAQAYRELKASVPLT